ncbi:hypothetical protein B0H12DRAFT_732669 [Mycena haematopus]|nr:hypothetical protein B0H12DRAFT_732669 [Mycena haematopus]
MYFPVSFSSSNIAYAPGLGRSENLKDELGEAEALTRSDESDPFEHSLSGDCPRFQERPLTIGFTPIIWYVQVPPTCFFIILDGNVRRVSISFSGRNTSSVRKASPIFRSTPRKRNKVPRFPAQRCSFLAAGITISQNVRLLWSRNPPPMYNPPSNDPFVGPCHPFPALNPLPNHVPLRVQHQRHFRISPADSPALVSGFYLLYAIIPLPWLGLASTLASTNAQLIAFMATSDSRAT